VRAGVLSAKQTMVSTIYPEARINYWIYLNHGVDTARGAPLMVWLDGQGLIGAPDAFNYRMQIVSDNLVHDGLIPPLVHVLIAPAEVGEMQPARFVGETQANAMRSLQYDAVGPRYGDFLLLELLSQVKGICPLRGDAYSCGAAGKSSGAAAAFNLGWFHPESFSRIHGDIPSFTDLRPEGEVSASSTARRIRVEPKRNLRLWLSAGAGDLEVDAGGRPDLFEAGSWPLHAIEVANALKLRGYDFHFRFGAGGHSTGQGALDLPYSLSWLWRGYDPMKTAVTFETEVAELDKPLFRIAVANRTTA
jgi:hypothetical protein